MYYFALLLLIFIVVTWRRDLKAAKKMYVNMLSELRLERMELDKLKSHYSELLNKSKNEDL
ncbi:hypothetical protein [Candidatus Magnetomonas plexicatena]|uniref:hypothetical protein n=1 Tax=Candidatus Magnetomonas plexicatena TaxID=2552947 RepID=UPI0011030857|nr:hypothetical protein E2O03_008525 [Nitrospirales bacterium LBB_01]